MGNREEASMVSIVNSKLTRFFGEMVKKKNDRRGTSYADEAESSNNNEEKKTPCGLNELSLGKESPIQRPSVKPKHNDFSPRQKTWGPT